MDKTDIELMEDVKDQLKKINEMPYKDIPLQESNSSALGSLKYSIEKLMEATEFPQLKKLCSSAIIELNGINHDAVIISDLARKDVQKHNTRPKRDYYIEKLSETIRQINKETKSLIEYKFPDKNEDKTSEIDI